MMRGRLPNPGANHHHVEGRHFGKYRGKVESNLDPEGLGRIEVTVDRFPGMRLNWALPSMPYGGPFVGAYAVPPRGACVWVEFEEGNLNFPIWTGCFWEVGEGLTKAMEDPLTAPLKAILQMENISIVVDNTPGLGGLTISIGGDAVPVPITITGDAKGLVVSVPPASVRITPEVIVATNEPGSVSISPEIVTAALTPTTLSLSETEASILLEPASITLAAGTVTVASEPSAIFLGSEGVTIVSADSIVGITAEAVAITSAEAVVTVSPEAIVLEIGASNISMAPVGLVVNDGALEVI